MNKLYILFDYNERSLIRLLKNIIGTRNYLHKYVFDLSGRHIKTPYSF